jgi:hypothetical protein
MEFFLLPASLLVLSIFLYLEELMTDHPNQFRAAVYVLALMLCFVSMILECTVG